MRIFRHFEDLPPEVKGGAVAIGNFDGVHMGHREVIGEAGWIAKAHRIPWVVLTFEPHPRMIFMPKQDPFRITPFRIKARHVEEMDVDHLVCLQFDMDFAKVSAEDFIQKVLVDGLAAKHVVCGYDFYFGAKRQGNPDMLLHKGREHGFGFTCVNPVTDNGGEAYSSTRVREYLVEGEPHQASGVLGRPFEIEGRVVEGDQRGRSIGFPTCNIELHEYLKPALGVYAIRAGVDHGTHTVWHDGVANIGKRPTFDKRDILLEAHLFDFEGDLYGKHLRVALVDFIRPEQKFDGLDEIKEQIAKDCIQAKDILKSTKPF
ncbi:bifunctional riboflavin kinase and FAD synthetase [Candidatus Terasakiella magnetica]|uniref:Riboflavin biosynthesis protein n=1 Tax=Candidatus Terasakiella magnetica TaxID=1867952 RepID=A0A1C3RII4_9PROT|nr:bifunctional riboflavin kinase/FAD synthetase [Candidatus Terasakiella magnetica]SCA57073.1 bifunctional riboflavin kinase and FAD synthetase [Candidatus Terasakiella magnetica]